VKRGAQKVVGIGKKGCCVHGMFGGRFGLAFPAVRFGLAFLLQHLFCNALSARQVSRFKWWTPGATYARYAECVLYTSCSSEGISVLVQTARTCLHMQLAAAYMHVCADMHTLL
jgi:hypothetical protein